MAEEPGHGTARRSDGMRIAPLKVEIVAVALLVPALILVQVALVGGFELFVRPLWLDEVHTHLLVSDPGLRHSLTALADGADYNPPLLYLVLRALRFGLGDLSPTALRMFSLACVVGALVAVYATLRARLSRSVAAVGALALWAQPLVVRHAFEARFYAPWLFLLAWLVFCLVHASRVRGRWPLVGVAIASVGLCTIHYLGVFSWALACVGYVVGTSPEARPRSLWIALGSGPVALLGCLPFYLGQRHAVGGVTWVPEPTLASVFEFLRMLVPGPLLALVVVAGAVELVRRRLRAGSVGAPFGVGAARTLAPLLVLVLLPVLYVPFSLLVQSVLVPKYATVTAIGWATLAALAASNMGPRLRAVLGISLLALSQGWLGAFVANERDARRREAHALRAVRAAPRGGVVFEDRHDLFPLLAFATGDTAPLRQLVRPVTAQADAVAYVENQVTRALARHYPVVRWVDVATLGALAPVLLVAQRDDRARIAREYAAFAPTRIGPRVYLLEGAPRPRPSTAEPAPSLR